MSENYIEGHVYFFSHAESNLYRALAEFKQEDAYTCINLLYHFYAFVECQHNLINALGDAELEGWKIEKSGWIRFARNTSTHGFATGKMRKKFCENRSTLCPEFDFVVLQAKPSERGMVKQWIETHILPIHDRFVKPKLAHITPRDYTFPDLEIAYE